MGIAIMASLLSCLYLRKQFKASYPVAAKNFLFFALLYYTIAGEFVTEADSIVGVDEIKKQHYAFLRQVLTKLLRLSQPIYFFIAKEKSERTKSPGQWINNIYHLHTMR